MPWAIGIFSAASDSSAVSAAIHVGIDRKTLAAEDGRLFQTAAYDFAEPAKKHHGGWKSCRYGFVIRTAADLQDNGVVRFGGEGRLSRLNKISDDVFKQPEYAYTNGLTLTLLTPALFEKGWLPGWLDSQTLTGTLPHTNLKVKLRATAIDRWLPVSGWDLQQHVPKAMRKAVAAGAVYWFEIQSGKTVTKGKSYCFPAATNIPTANGVIRRGWIKTRVVRTTPARPPWTNALH